MKAGARAAAHRSIVRAACDHADSRSGSRVCAVSGASLTSARTGPPRRGLPHVSGLAMLFAAATIECVVAWTDMSRARRGRDGLAARHIACRMSDATVWQRRRAHSAIDLCQFAHRGTRSLAAAPSIRRGKDCGADLYFARVHDHADLAAVRDPPDRRRSSIASQLVLES